MTGYGFDRSVLPASYVFTVATLRYSAARPSRNPIVIVLLLVLVLDRPISDDENEDDDEDERFTRPATIWTDTDAARQSRNQYVPTTDEHGWTRIRESLSSSVLIRVHPWLKKSSRAATISGDTDRLAVCATNTTEALNAYDAREDSRDGCPTVARPCSWSQCAQNMAWGLSMN